MENSNMVPISVIATDICNNFGDTDRKYWGEHVINIINEYKDFHIFLMNEINVKSQIMPFSNIQDLPCDFVKETKVGIINSQGRIATMSIDKSLRVPQQNITSGQLDQSLEDIMLNRAEAVFYPFYNVHGLDGGFVGELYGFACSINTLGYFNIDRKNRTLITSSAIHPSHEVILEYKSDGVSDGLQLVPTEIVNCLKNRCKAVFCLDKKDNRYVAFQNQFEVQYKQIKRLYHSKPIDVYASVFKRYHQSAPK